MYHPSFYSTISLVPLRVRSNLLSRREESHESKGEKGRGGQRKRERRKENSLWSAFFPYHWYKSKTKFKPTCECGGTKKQRQPQVNFKLCSLPKKLPLTPTLPSYLLLGLSLSTYCGLTMYWEFRIQQVLQVKILLSM